MVRWAASVTRGGADEQAGHGPAADRDGASVSVRPLIDERLEGLLALMEGADSAELKLTVPDAGRRSAVAALEMDPLEAQIRQVAFFDTPDLALDRAGVVVRARRVQGRDDDTVVKLRPVVPGDLPAGGRRARNLV